MSEPADLAVVAQKAYEFNLWMLPHAGKFPRTYLSIPSSQKARPVDRDVNCFVPLVLVASWHPKDLIGMNPEEQLRVIRGRLLELWPISSPITEA